MFMRSSLVSRGTQVFAAAALALAGLAGPAGAIAIQQVSASFTALDGTVVDSATDIDIAPDTAGLSRDLFAGVVASSYSGTVMLDPMGNLAIDASLFQAGTLRVEAVSTLDGLENLSSPVIQARLLIDGGLLSLLGPAGSHIDLTVEVTASGNFPFPDSDVNSFRIQMEMPVDFGVASVVVHEVGQDELMTETADSGLPNQLDIPFQIFDISLAPVASGPLTLEYRAALEIFSPGLAEIALVEYRDPLSVIFEPPTFIPNDPVSAVPAPASALLLLSGLVGIRVFGGRRRHLPATEAVCTSASSGRAGWDRRDRGNNRG